MDDISQPILLDDLINFALSFFSRINETPISTTYHFASEPNFKKTSFETFRIRMTGYGHHVGSALHSVTITSKGYEPNSASDVWTPRAVVSVAVHGQVLGAFIQSPIDIPYEYEALVNLSIEIFGTSFGAGYVFPFPWAFSPLAYASGMTFSPNIKRLGCLTDRDSERVANWGNHCYRGHHASEGYLRDIYSLNIIGATQLGRLVDGITLEKWIRADSTRGSLSFSHGKVVWMIDDEQLAFVQGELDNVGLLLSGFPPH